MKFYRGLQLIGTDTTAPYSLSQTVVASDHGTYPYVAVAFDAAGNMKLSNVISVTVTIPVQPLVFSFSATPSALPVGGGVTTLSWHVAGANSVSISPDIGQVAQNGSLAVAVTQSTDYVLTATNAAGTTMATASVTVPVTLPPIILSFNASPSTVPAGGGTSILSWNVLGSGVSVSIDQGIGDVTGLTLKSVGVVATTTYRLTATGPGGTSTRDVTVTVSNDTMPPSVSLTADPTAVVAPGSTTLTATANDNIGVIKVEFVRGGKVIAADSTAGDGFNVSINFSEADAGTATFTARAYDAVGNSTESNAVNVMVSVARPNISSFTAIPEILPPRSGQATLTWNVIGATNVSIDGGVGTVAAQGPTTVQLTQPQRSSLPPTMLEELRQPTLPSQWTPSPGSIYVTNNSIFKGVAKWSG